jgi:hypothetical protein
VTAVALAYLHGHAHSHGFVTYLWHYVLARLVYDSLVRPIAHGEGVTVLLAIATVCAVVALMRRARRRRRWSR